MNQRFKREGINILVVAAAATCNFIQLELCNGNSLGMSLGYICMNIGVLVCLYAVCYAIVNRLHVVIILCSLLSTVLAVANYYVVQFRGMPLSTKDFKNLGTALTVVGSYRFQMDKRVAVTLILFGLMILTALYMRKRGKNRSRTIAIGIRNILLSLACSGGFLYICFFAEWSLKPKNTFGWSWELAYHQYGYLAESLEILEASLTMVEKPEGYSEETAAQLLGEIETEETGAEEQLPTIIFILNESWYDLETIVELECEQEIMPEINGTVNAVQGYCVVPTVGTNLSEYELLTGNSLQLMQGITPFNSLNMSGSESLVSVLKEAGYDTTAMHPAVATNYSRNIAYPAMGFDHILFEEDFTTVELYGERPHLTDSAAYQTLIQQFEENKENGPQFLYLLTIQNHGGWEVNDQEYDTVSLENDFGVYREMTEEYLSCIQLTDQAWKELTEYFSSVDEPVLICMVGDHAPSFAEILARYWSSCSEEELMILLNATPYIIWTNYDLELQELGNISMNYLGSAILDMVGINTDAYYNYMAELRQSIPVLSSFNLYITADGIQYAYSDKNEYSEQIQNYFIMEYDRIKQ